MWRFGFSWCVLQRTKWTVWTKSTNSPSTWSTPSTSSTAKLLHLLQLLLQFLYPFDQPERAARQHIPVEVIDDPPMLHGLDLRPARAGP